MATQEEIHAKGFDLFEHKQNQIDTDFNKIKVGTKTLDDAVLDLNFFEKNSQYSMLGDKKYIIQALANKDYKTLRKISDFFYSINGIYERVCNYFAFLYRYDWYITAEYDEDNLNKNKMLKDYAKILNFLDNSYIKKLCGDISLEVIKNGVYYGYLVPSDDRIIIQELPANYCRSRYNINGLPAVEFNMQYFDQQFKDLQYRLKVLNLFPDEFKKGYTLFKQGKLVTDQTGTGYNNTSAGWYLLDTERAFKFNFNNSDIPIFVSAIPAIIDLEDAQALDRRKQMQKLLKVLVQKLPMDKNGELIFDNDEARDIHNNAVAMLKRAIGVDILTTFADIEAIDMSDKNTTTTKDDLQKVERSVFNQMGISQNLFNTDGNLSLQKSILNDESSARNLLLQFNIFFDRIVQQMTRSKKYSFRLFFLETTQYNYQELAKLYKEQASMGFSHLLPQIALGHSQSFIFKAAYFENKILEVNQFMIPPLSSATMSGTDILGVSKQKTSSQNNNKTEESSDNQGGRPEKSEGEKSDKTMQNLESMN